MDKIRRHWFFEDAKLSEIPFLERTFNQKIRVIRFNILLRILRVFAIIISGELNKRKSKKQELNNKLKYFKPTIHEGIFSKKIIWEQRNIPLTDTELKNLNKTVL